MQLDLLRDRLLELPGGGGHDVHAGVAQLGRDLGALEDGVDLAVELVDQRLGRLGGNEQADPGDHGPN